MNNTEINLNISTDGNGGYVVSLNGEQLGYLEPEDHWTKLDEHGDPEDITTTFLVWTNEGNPVGVVNARTLFDGACRLAKLV